MSDQQTTCPICGAVPRASPEGIGGKDATAFECPRCGNYQLDNPYLPALRRRVVENPQEAAIVSHVVRRMQSSGKPPFLDTSLWDSILLNTPPPSPAEQAENLILWLGSSVNAPGEYQLFDPLSRAIVGALSDENLWWVFEHLMSEGLLQGTETGTAVRLSFAGWRAYEEIKRASPRQTRRAFMAMPYGNELLDRVFRDYFKPAAERAGFALLRLDEKPEAGVIDDKIRLEILRSRFVVAELTGGNHGAYWEAGYAEGLGRPVIYTCERAYFEDPGTHFDAEHLHTVVWEEATLAAAAERLTLTIRTTLPQEAKLDDA